MNCVRRAVAPARALRNSVVMTPRQRIGASPHFLSAAAAASGATALRAVPDAASDAGDPACANWCAPSAAPGRPAPEKGFPAIVGDRQMPGHDTIDAGGEYRSSAAGETLAAFSAAWAAGASARHSAPETDALHLDG